ncbi:MAG: hypothetical protein U0T74_02570 [Chitinophagales bacterium]
MYFTDVDCMNNDVQLFETDGTVLGTSAIYYAQTTVAGNLVNSLFSFNGNLYFNARYDTKGAELCRLNTPTGISEADETDIRIYPNPVTDEVHVSGLQTGTTLTLFDVSELELQRFTVEEPIVKNR